MFDPAAAAARRKNAAARNAVAETARRSARRADHGGEWRTGFHRQFLDRNRRTATPKPIIDKLNRATNTALKGPATQAKLKPLEAQAMFGTPADYADFLISELPKWTAMAKLSGAATE